MGEIDSIVPDFDEDSVGKPTSGTGGQRVILKSGTLKSLAKPIKRWGNGRKVSKSIRFKTMAEFSDATKLDQS